MHYLQKMTWLRPAAVIIAAAIALVSFSPAEVRMKAEAFSSSDYVDEYGDFLYELGTMESGNDYSVESGQYLGYWQMGDAALIEAGFIDASGGWTEFAGSFGISDKESFLASEEGQDYAVLAYHKKIYYYACNMGVDNYIGTDVGGVEMTFSGMIAGAHVLGIGALKSLIVNGTSGNSGNDSIALKYMNVCGGYDIESTIYGDASFDADSIVTTTTTTATTTTTTTVTTTATTTTTQLKVPSHITVKPESDVVIAGDFIKLYIESDNADYYLVNITAPGNIVTEYILAGSMIGITAKSTGIYAIDVTAVNSAGESSAETVFVFVQAKPILDEEDIGDVNSDGSVDISDASLIIQYYSCATVGAVMPGEGVFNVYCADVDDNNVIELKDGSFVLSFYSHKAAGIDVSWSDITGK